MNNSVPSVESEPRAPTAIEMLALLALAPLVSVALFAAANRSWAGAVVVAVTAAAATMLIGWPVVFWMFDHGRTRLRHALVAGAVLGALPLVVALVSGTLGLYIRTNDTAMIRRAFRFGAPIPWYGVLPWAQFRWLELLSIASGLAVLASFYVVIVRREPKA